MLWEDLCEREAQGLKAETLKECANDSWRQERLGTLSKDTLFRRQQLCKLRQLHQNDIWFQATFFIPTGTIHKAPFMAVAGDTGWSNIICVKKTWVNTEQQQLNQKEQNHRQRLWCKPQHCWDQFSFFCLFRQWAVWIGNSGSPAQYGGWDNQTL